MGRNGSWQKIKAGFGKGYWMQLVGLVVITSIVITLFGLAFEKGPTSDINVDIVNLDSTEGGQSTATAIIERMKSGSTVNVVNLRGPSDVDPVQSSLDDLESGKVEAVIVFGQNFTAGISAWISSARNGTTAPPSNVVLYLDSSNPISTAAVQADVAQSVQVVLASTYQLSQPVRVVPDIVYGEGTDMRDFMAPAIAGLLIFILTLMPTLMSRMGGEGREQTLLSRGDSVGVTVLTSLVTGMALSLAILAILSLFGIRMAGDMSASFILLTLLAVSSAGLGLLLSAALRGRSSASLAVFPLLLYPAILLGGIVLPVSAIPDYLTPISYIYPLTYAIDGSRLVMLNGFGWEGCAVQVLALVIYSAICFGTVWWVGRRATFKLAAPQNGG